jgi:hypothetical protein
VERYALGEVEVLVDKAGKGSGYAELPAGSGWLCSFLGATQLSRPDKKPSCLHSFPGF